MKFLIVEEFSAILGPNIRLRILFSIQILATEVGKKVKTKEAVSLFIGSEAFCSVDESKD